MPVKVSIEGQIERLSLSPHEKHRLDVQLLNRTTRSVAPTTAGSRLHERIAPMILEMDAAVAEAVAATGRTAGTLRINTLGMAAKKLIAPRLGRFPTEPARSPVSSPWRRRAEPTGRSP